MASGAQIPEGTGTKPFLPLTAIAATTTIVATRALAVVLLRWVRSVVNNKSWNIKPNVPSKAPALYKTAYQVVGYLPMSWYSIYSKGY